MLAKAAGEKEQTSYDIKVLFTGEEKGESLLELANDMSNEQKSVA